MRIPLYLDEWILKKTETMETSLTREVLEKYQRQKLMETLHRVLGNSRFYREKLGEFDSRSIRSLSDIAKLPFTTMEELSERGKDMICVPQDAISRIVSLNTSGTTGVPKRVYYTVFDQELTIDYFHHGMQNLTDSRDRVLILLPCQSPGSVGDLLRIGLKRLGAFPVPYGLVDEPRKVLEVLRAEKITSMVGNPNQVLSVALADQTMSGNGAALFGSCVRSVLLSTDYIPESTCQTIESIWGCKVYEHYGMTEMGLGCAVSCHVREGCHPREADLYLEIVDPDTGQVQPDGCYGEIVFTTLTREAMPLIRYRTGDISRFLPSPCPCGSVLKRLEKVGKRDREKNWRTSL